MRPLPNLTKATMGVVLLAFVVITAGFSPTSANKSSQDDIKALAKKGVDAWNNRTPEVIDQIFAPKMIYHSGSATEGSEASFRAIYENNIATFPDFKITIDDIIADGNKVLMRLISEGTHKEFGKKVRFVEHWIGRVENGKFVEAWEVVDFLTMYKQLGYTITPPEQQAEK